MREKTSPRKENWKDPGNMFLIFLFADFQMQNSSDLCKVNRDLRENWGIK